MKIISQTNNQAYKNRHFAFGKAQALKAMTTSDKNTPLKGSRKTQPQNAPLYAILFSGTAITATAAAVIALRKQGSKLGKEFMKPRAGNNIISKIPDEFSTLKKNLTEVTIETADKVKLKCWDIKPKDNNKPYVIYCHGTATNLQENAEALDKFAKKGYGVFGLEYRGYSQNAGKVTEKGLNLDAQAALDHVKKQGYKKIGVHGHSLGGAVAVDLASKNKLDFLIINSSFTSAQKLAKSISKKGLKGVKVPEYIKKVIENTPEKLIPTGVDFNSIGKLKKVDPSCNVFIIHSEGDRLIPHTMATELKNEASKHIKNVSLHITPHNNSNGHNTIKDKSHHITKFLSNIYGDLNKD